MSGLRTVESGEAFEVLVGGDGSIPVLLTCEHASMDLPDGWTWPEADRRVVGDHWSWDPGAAALCRALAEDLGAGAVLARFTRLLCDPNRPEGGENLFREVADGAPIALNGGLDEAERERRIARFHRPYHAAVDRAAVRWPGTLIFSVHTFTPVYEGQRRDVEVAVLFDHDDDLGIDLAMALVDRGVTTWLNEPWSGKDGLIFSARRAADAHGRAALEIEVRNDLAADPAWRAENAPRIADALREILSPRVEEPDEDEGIEPEAR